MSDIATIFLSRQEFKNLYKERTYAIAYNLKRLYKKRTKSTEHIQFLKQYKKHNLVPNGLKLKHTTTINKNQKLLETVVYKIRNKTLKNQVNILKSQLKTILNSLMLQPERQHQNNVKWINKCDEKYKNKLIKTHNK